MHPWSDNVTRRVDIHTAGTHAGIYLDAASTGDTTGLNKVNYWFNADSNQDHFAGNGLAMRGDNAQNPPISPHDLRDFLPGMHVYTVPAFFVQHYIRGDSIKHL